MSESPISAHDVMHSGMSRRMIRGVVFMGYYIETIDTMALHQESRLIEMLRAYRELLQF